MACALNAPTTGIPVLRVLIRIPSYEIFLFAICLFLRATGFPLTEKQLSRIDLIQIEFIETIALNRAIRKNQRGEPFLNRAV
ncbi:MAG: hypothetical protein BWX44_01394 [Spirochaetes bacterium ADurb.Bin001]|nr:MAG: hypothetical protein BWX44_01394 [Spirochaetes bacterium ADurb.Bin001]